MLKQILCWSLLIGQLYAGEHPRPPLPSGMNASEVNAAFMRRFPGVPTELPTIRNESSSSSVSDAQSADQAPTVSEDSDRRKGPKFTGAEDAGIMQYVQDHPRKKQNWEECLKDLTEQGIIAPGARTAKQLNVRYNCCLKTRFKNPSSISGAIALPVAQAPAFPVPILGGSHSVRMSAAGQPSNLQGMLQSPQGLLLNSPFLMSGGNQVEGAIDSSVGSVPETPSSDSTQEEAATVLGESDRRRTPKFTEAEDAGIFQYLRANPGRPNWNACLKQLVEQGIIAPGTRTARQLKNRYNGTLRLLPEFAAVSCQDSTPEFRAAEDTGILQYVQNHPGRQDWDECLKNLTEQGIIAPGARTSKQLCRRYNRYLKQRPEFAAVSGGNYAPRFTKAEDEALLQIVREHPELSWEERAKLFAERMEDKSDVSRPANQLKNRYSNYLKKL